MAKLKRSAILIGLAVVIVCMAGLAAFRSSTKSQSPPEIPAPVVKTSNTPRETDHTIFVEDLLLDSFAASPIMISKLYRVVFAPFVTLPSSGDTTVARRLGENLKAVISQRSDIVLLERGEELDLLIEEWALNLAEPPEELPRALLIADYVLAPSVLTGDGGRVAVFLKFISVRSTIVAASTYGEAHEADIERLLPLLLDKLVNSTPAEPAVQADQIEKSPEMAAAYQKGLGVFHQNEVYDACALFMEVAHGTSSYAPEAQYSVGKSYAKMGRHRDAILAWESYRLRYPNGPRNAEIRVAIAQQKRLAGR